MPRAITMWEDASGAVHRTEDEAHRADLRLILAELADSPVIARQIVDRITPETAGRMVLLLAVIRDA